MRKTLIYQGMCQASSFLFVLTSPLHPLELERGKRASGHPAKPPERTAQACPRSPQPLSQPLDHSPSHHFIPHARGPRVPAWLPGDGSRPDPRSRGVRTSMRLYGTFRDAPHLGEVFRICEQRFTSCWWDMVERTNSPVSAETAGAVVARGTRMGSAHRPTHCSLAASHLAAVHASHLPTHAGK